MNTYMPKETAEEKCKLGQGEDCCAYLGFDQGWHCLRGTSAESLINQRLADGTMGAKGVYCVNNKGKIGVYREGGCELEVEVVEDNSDATRYAYVLKVLSIKEDEPGMEVGSTFSVMSMKDALMYSMWDLNIKA